MNNQLSDINAAILDALPIGALWIHQSGKVLYANTKALSILGTPPESIVGESCSDTLWQILDLKGNPVTDLDDLFSGLLSGGKNMSDLRYTARRPDGQHIYLTSKLSILNDSNSDIGVICTIENLRDDGTTESDRVRLQAAVKRAHKVESIGRLAGGVAHNLNNILSPIIGYSDMALESLDANDPLHDQLQDIRSATERATELVRQLLAFARRQSFELHPLDLGLVVTDLEAILRQSIPENIKLDLTGCLAVEPVMADLSQVRQIIIALLLNASESIEKTGRITVLTQDVTVDSGNADSHREIRFGRYAMLAIADTGRGMTGDTISHVFEPFFTTKEVGQGSGLGLSTVYGIVKQHGGSINVNSKVGIGSTFRVYLPKKNEKPFASEKTQNGSKTGDNQETILVVEDEESLLKFTSIVLKKSGYTVLEASGGTEALKIAEQQRDRIHLLLTDVIMPGMNGKEIYKAISKLQPEMKILYTSGYPDDVIARHGIVDKGENLLPKPTTVDKLTTKVRQVLDE